MLSLIIMIPLFGIMLLNIPVKNVMKRLAFWFATALFLSQIGLAVFHQQTIGAFGAKIMDPFLHVLLSTDNLSFVMLICIGTVSIASLIVARYSITDRDARFNFINLLMIASVGMTGIVLVNDIFSMYVFIEITAVASFILIAMQKDTSALEGAFKYFILSSIATVLMLSSIALIFLTAGSTEFSSVREAISLSQGSFIIKLAMALFMCGLFIKGGLVPFHGWLPDAYSSASSPVSVLLAGIVTKASGIYTIIRVITAVFGFSQYFKETLLVVGTLSVLVGAFAALGQTNFKRILSYSSISQVGYIILGFGAGTTLGIAGAVFHIFNHSIFKSLLFVNSAAVESRTGTNDITKMGGLSSRMPITGSTSVIALLSASGIPPLAGFWSKIIIIIALWQSANKAYAVIAVMASVLTLAYLLILQRKVFFGKISKGLEGLKEVDFGFAAISVILAVIIIGTGIFFPLILNKFILPISSVLISI